MSFKKKSNHNFKGLGQLYNVCNFGVEWYRTSSVFRILTNLKFLLLKKMFYSRIRLIA